MSEVDKNDYKNEYLPLVNTHSEDRGMVNRSVSSDQKFGRITGAAANVNLRGDTEETFFQKNKKTIKILGIALLVIGVILAIVLPLTLKKKNPDNPPNPPGPPGPPVPPVPPVPPQPDPVQPDPFHFQEFNPYTLDNSIPPVVDTFKANFMLKYNFKAAKSHHESSDIRVHRKRDAKKVPKVIRNFMGYNEEEAEKQIKQAPSNDQQLNGTNYRPVNPTYIINSPNNQWSARINVSVSMNKGQQARVLITNPDADYNETQRRLVNDDFLQRPGLEIESRLQQVGFHYNATASFAFNFTDIYAQETLISTMYRKMLVTDLYSEIGLVLPTQRCYGLGQRNGKFQVNQGTYTFNARARDESLPQDDGLGGKSGNHIHPFMMCQTGVTKEFFGIFFVSNGPQVFEVIKYANSTKMVLNYITIGGGLEFYVIMLGNAQNIVSRYQSIVGMPVMPPYYALGMFHGSNSYNSWSQIKAVYDNYNGNVTGEKQALEGVFVENYNQQAHWSFTVNNEKFPNLAAEVDNIHSRNQRIIFGASLALNPDPTFPWFAQAKSAQCLVRSIGTIANGPLTGYLDQTEVTYLDSFSGCFDSFLANILPGFNVNVARGFDGLLLKDAHAPNHVNGQLRIPTSAGVKTDKKLSAGGFSFIDQPDFDPVQTPLNEEMVGFYMPYQLNNDTQQYQDLSTYYLPFIPAFKFSGALDNMSISLNATLGNPTRYSTLLVRNGMAGYAIKRTYNVMQQKILKNNTRALLFSDASWAGSGSYSAALLTDQFRSWSDMSNVINQVHALSMYGFSATMVDTCGSLGPMDEDLCARWTQLATFMPMVRNYFNETYRDPATGQRVNTPSSEPWNAKKDKLKLANAAIGDRLKLTRYIYSQMYMAHANGGSLAHPLFFDFPTDDGSFNDASISQTYMLGDSVKVSPVLSNLNDGDKYQAYFPPGKWVNIYDPSLIIDATKGGVNATLTADSASVNIHQKSGTVLPFLYNNQNLRTTRDIETNLPTAIRIVRDPWNKQASGDLMIDDGISPNLFSPDYFNIYQWKVFDKNFTHWNIRVSSGNTINFQLLNGDIDYKPASNMMYQYLDKIEIHDAEDLKNVDFVCGINRGFGFINMTVFYNDGTKTLTLKPDANNVTFDQLNIIKFGQTGKDPQYCKGFFYTSQMREENDTYARFDLLPSEKGLLQELVAEFWLLDDEGSINVEITSSADYNTTEGILYRPPVPEFYSLNYFHQNLPTKNLFEFLQQEDGKEFSYKILNTKGEVVYSSDPLRLLVDTHFVINGGLFKTNPKNGYPLYGIGERAGRAHLKDQQDFVHTIWPQDQPNPIDDGKPPGKNMYGYQPVYYYQADTLDWMAVFDVGTYPSDYFVNTNVDGAMTTRVTKVAAGGMIHKIFLQGQTIEQTMIKYQRVTGFQTVPPMWAFGWNQCKFGYVDSQMWWSVYQNYKLYNLPLDTMWGDIDYMDDYKVFTYSNQSYPDLPDKVKIIKSEGRHFVPIIDDAIAVRPNQNYTPYEDGLKQGVFVMRKDLSGPTTGGVWPGHAYYPDFFKTATQQWWSKNLQEFNKKIDFDGIWLDMNEASSTCTGYCYDSERPRDAVKYQLPYWPGSRDLEIQVLGLDSVYTGVPNGQGGYRTELDLRSMYAIKESQATFNYLKQNNKRPFVLSRSNAPGLQKYAFHWLADNWATEEWLSTSVDSLFEYNLFGIPMMGSDICGFNIEATPELCTRWHQLGSFYPFSRNHKNSVWKQTEPFQYNFTVSELNDGRTYTDLIRTALLQRYSILRYIYSEFHQIGQFGGAFFKPLYYEYQDDPMTFDDDANQVNIQLGHALKLSIQTRDLNQQSTQYLFPASRWCQVMPTIDKSQCWDTTSQGGDSTLQRLNSSIADYQVHIRGGHIMTFQDAVGLKVQMTQDLMKNPTELIALTNLANSPMTLPTGTYNAIAVGYIYLDDGSSSVDIARVDFYVFLDKDGSAQLRFKTITPPQKTDDKGEAATVSAITFLWASSTGFDKYVSKVPILFQAEGGQVDLKNPTYDSATDTLRLEIKGDSPIQTWNFWEIDYITLGK